MTKFTSLSKKEKLETKFRYILCDGSLSLTSAKPSTYDNVLYIGYDEDYGDVFKCWDDGLVDGFVLFFGVKGDEFD